MLVNGKHPIQCQSKQEESKCPPESEYSPSVEIIPSLDGQKEENEMRSSRGKGKGRGNLGDEVHQLRPKHRESV